MVFSRLLLILTLGLATSVLAADGQKSAADDQKRDLRVGGTYKVTEIEKRGNRDFKIYFESADKQGPHQKLLLHSDHLHLGVKEGSEIRLSAEILVVKDGVTEVSQLLLFLKSDQGITPVWMLSRKHQGQQLNGARYLEMHAPVADYIVF